MATEQQAMSAQSVESSESVKSSESVDLVVIGGGPAGMAAASTALHGGLRVVLVDAGVTLGGQYWRHPAPGLVPDGARFHHDLATYRALVGDLETHRAARRFDLRLQHQVWTVARTPDGFVVHALDRSGGVGAEREVILTTPQVLIATGAFDRQLPFPGWDLPGVFTAGGLQALLKGHGVSAGSRVIVAGTGPFLLPVATGLAAAGAEVVEICEANSPTLWARHARTLLGSPAKGLEAAGYAVSLARHRIPVRTSTAVVAAHGNQRLDAVTIAKVDATGTVRRGSERRVAVDALGVGWGFVPQLDLAITLGVRLIASDDGNQVADVDDDQRSSVPGVLIAGELTGVGGAALALREGQLAGEAALADAGRPPATEPRRRGQIRREVARSKAFAHAMRLSHPVPAAWSTWLTDDTPVCRCEEVTAARVRAAVIAGATDARQIKQLTRTGMGWCQGRMCGYAAACLAEESAPGDPGGGGELAPTAYASMERLAGESAPGDPGGGGELAPTAYASMERLVAAPVPLGALTGPGHRGDPQ